METKSKPDVSHQKSWLESNKRRAVGIGYLIGDSALFADGLISALRQPKGSDERSAEMKTAFAGLLWWVGGATMAKYGNRSVEKQFTALENRLAEYFYKQGVTLSPDVLEKARKEVNKGLWGQLEDFLYKYPTEVLNAVYGIGAAGLVAGGYSKLQKSLKDAAPGEKWQKADFGTLGMGVTILAGALTGLLVKEKPKAELALMPQPKTWLGKVIRRTQARPMDTTGIFYLLNNLFTIKATHERFVDREKGTPYEHLYLLKASTAASYIFSNLTLRTVSTTADTGDKAISEQAREELLTGASAVILAQPPELRNLLIGQAAQFLSQQKELGFYDFNAASIAEMVEENLNRYEAKHAAAGTSAESASWAMRSSDTAPQPEGVSR